MSDSFFYMQCDENQKNHALLDALRSYSESEKCQIYVIDRPLGDSKYTYSHTDAFILLIPKRKITFVDFSQRPQSFTNYIEDVIEDLGSISDKFRYKESIGRPRNWRDLIHEVSVGDNTPSVEEIINESEIIDPLRQRVCELLISLLTGSINDIEKVKVEIPVELLDKVKQKIVLFDGDQTRFIYQKPSKDAIRIQGLSGTGKTELLLHKLKELYTESSSSRIVFTCHNKILADNLKKRIPDFFDFMKVEQQIQWESRLWCIHAWGSTNNPNSGTYRLICEHFGIPFETYSPASTFDSICKRAISVIKGKKSENRPFDYILIDESQDFPDSFFELCQAAATTAVYIAGDIFQSIFDNPSKSTTEPDYLLSKCYRTDPRTLMFAHALGMGLFEKQKLRWLEDKEWQACGYLVDVDANTGVYRLRREPLRRFEDIDWRQHNSVLLVKQQGRFYQQAPEIIISLLKKIIEENPTAGPDDIGVILLDKSSNAYTLADRLEVEVPRQLRWMVNKAYESKRKSKGSLFVSNRNNVKGLEFPFVICITERVLDSHGYRNALYMTMTRSFLQTYLVLSEEQNAQLIKQVEGGLTVINSAGYIQTTPPSGAEAEAIKTTIKHTDTSASFFDIATKVFDDIGVMPLFRDPLFDAVRKVVGEDFDYESVREIAAFNYERMHRGGK